MKSTKRTIKRKLNWKLLTIWIAVVAFAFLMVFIYKAVLYPSYMSIQSGCGYINDAELKEKGFVVTGQTFVSYDYNVSSGETEINTTVVQVFHSADKSTLRHEYIHVLQARQHRLFSCADPVMLFLNEVEAYALEDLPLFNKQIALMRNGSYGIDYSEKVSRD